MNARNPTIDRDYEESRFLRRRGNLKVRRERRLRVLSRRLFRGALLAGLILVLAWGFRSARRWAVTTPALAVTDLQIVGATHADEKEVRALLAGVMDRNMFALDLDTIVSTARRHRWVRSAVAQRHLPGTLVVRIEEREACALLLIDNQAFLMDTSGVRIDRFGSPYRNWSLPVFRGMDELEPVERLRRSRQAAAQLDGLRTEYPEFFARLAEVDLQDSRSTLLSFEGGKERWKVLPGEWVRNIDAYRALRREILEKHDSMKYVDLRWQGKVIAATEVSNG